MKSEHGSGLRIGDDAGWIIIRGSGDDARSKYFEEFFGLFENFAHPSHSLVGLCICNQTSRK